MSGTSPHIDCRWLAEQITDYSSRGIASRVTELVWSGKIAVGSHLPPIRALAEQLAMSPAAISLAWTILRKQKMIDGHRRNGVWISAVPQQNSPEPGDAKVEGDKLDLGWSVPDPMLLPDLSQAVLYGLQSRQLNHYQRIAIVPELEQQAREHWPYPAPALLVTDGSIAGINTILHA
ncbi:MAG: GntR family transcriptional regulator, partial [Enterobacteriaceae bacterium]